MSWWLHQMETFSAQLALCAGNSSVPVNSPHKGQWRGALMFFFYLRLNKRLSKQPWGWWFETPSWSLWRHFNIFRYSRNFLTPNWYDTYRYLGVSYFIASYYFLKTFYVCAYRSSLIVYILIVLHTICLILICRRALAPVATVICWLHPTLDVFNLISFYRTTDT